MTTDRRQGLIGNLGIKKAVKVATTATITLEGLQTIDNVALVEGDRVLVKNQADLTTNGIYDVSSGSWTRSLDFDGNGDIVNGTLIFVTNGSVNASRLFSTVVTDPITVGSSNIQFNFAIAFGDTGLIASNNLSDVPNKSTARDNLGLEIGTDIPSYFDVSKYASGNFYIDSSVSANTYVLTKTASLVNPVDGSNNYYIGMTIKFRPNYNNTGASTVNVNSAGVKNLKKEDGTTNVTTGDITTTKDVEFRYDGTNFVQSNSIVLATNSVRGISFLSNPITIAFNSSTTMDISAGVVNYDNGSGQLNCSAITGKILQASGSWTAGSSNNGLDTGARANSTWYNIFEIVNNTTNANDILYSTSRTSPTIPSGYTLVAWIGKIRTDSSGNIDQSYFAKRTNYGQIVYFATGAVSTTTTTIPRDDTIPQNTEGAEFMQLPIEPISSSSILEIDVEAMLSNAGTSITNIGAIFKDSVANALVCGEQFSYASQSAGMLKLNSRVISGATSTITFKFRAGPESATTLTFNGYASARKYGGVANSYITIKEYL